MTAVSVRLLDDFHRIEYEPCRCHSDPPDWVVICDVGESCGAYVTLDGVAVVDVDQDHNGFSFHMGFKVVIVAALGPSGHQTTRPMSLTVYSYLLTEALRVYQRL